MSQIANYEEQVYAAVLGKVIGVYMGKPIEGWRKPKVVDHWGSVDRYLAAEMKVPLVAADDDISGTFTFIRALEDSGLYAETPEEYFGNTWLNYLIEMKTVLWWAGLGVSTEHTAYLRLKNGVQSPQSGSMALNGRVVSEQIGAQIFIDAFGMVAPGDPQLAAKLARSAARVSHDGEAVYAAQVVAAMVAAAFVEKDMEKLLDIGVSVIPLDSLIARLHRDVRAWCKEDRNWHTTFERIAAEYGYASYGGGCHIIPNHAIMVMAWSYAPTSFRESQAIINTAGWDTDCNAANVGSVMGVVVGLEGINREYDFQAPIADRILLPTAEGTRFISDCLQEAIHIAGIGRKIMGWPALPAPKDGAWHHFSLPQSRHGYLPEPTEHGTPGLAGTRNVEGPDGARMLEIAFRHLSPTRPTRVSTPVYSESQGGSYALMGTPRIYAGQTVTVTGYHQPVDDAASLRLFLRHFMPDANTSNGITTAIVYSDSVDLSGDGKFTISLPVPDADGYPMKDFGFEITGDTGVGGSVLIDRVSYAGTPQLRFPPDLPHTTQRSFPGWIADLDSRAMWVFPGWVIPGDDDITCLGKNRGRGVLVTGTTEWTDYTLSCKFAVHCGEKAGLIVRYQGLRRFLALTRTGDTLQIVRHHDGTETVLAETPCAWEIDVFHHLSLTVKGTSVTAMLDGVPVLSATDDILRNGGAGFFIEEGVAGVYEVEISGEGA